MTTTTTTTPPPTTTPTTDRPDEEAPTVQAIVQDAFGTDPDEVLRLEQVPVPTPGPGEVRVRVRAAGVDRGVWHLMAGRPYAVRLAGFGVRRPRYRTLGSDLAGVVDAVGADVEGFTPGDEVYGVTRGSFTEMAIVPAAKLARMPAGLSFVEAAAVPVSGLTALQAVRDKAAVRPGERVLVVGASGGVGSYAVQVARAAGAVVTGVARTAKLDVVRGLGAVEVIDHTREDFADGTRQWDVIIDIGGNRRLRDLRRALTPGGRLVIVGGETDGRWLGGSDRQLRAMLLSPFVGQTLTSLMSKETAADLDVLRELVEAGQVTPAVERTYPLAETAAAIRHVAEGRARGKVVVTVSA